MDGAALTRHSGFSSDGIGPRPRTGAASTTNPCDVTRGVGGEPLQQNSSAAAMGESRNNKFSPPGAGFLGITLSPLRFMTPTDQEPSSRGHRETESQLHPPATLPRREALPATNGDLRPIGKSPLPPRQIGGKAQDGETPRMARNGLGATARPGDYAGMLSCSRGEQWESGSAQVDEVLDRIWFGQWILMR